MDKGLTVVPKWVLIVQPKSPKYPKCPRIYLPSLSAQAQTFYILMKKGFIGRPLSVPKSILCSCAVVTPLSHLHYSAAQGREYVPM